MNEKEYRFYIVIIIVIAVLLIFAGGVGGFVIRGAHTADNSGIADYQQRERDLLARIGEYQQREQDRIARERESAAREAERLKREGERIARTENAIGAIRESDRRERNLYQELAKEADILADFFAGVKREHDNAVNNDDSGGE